MSLEYQADGSTNTGGISPVLHGLVPGNPYRLLTLYLNDRAMALPGFPERTPRRLVRRLRLVGKRPITR